MGYYCGWDGGGSKTEVLCCDASGQETGRAVFGPLNINGAPRERVRQTIADAVAYMASMPDGLAGCVRLVIGAAGVSNVEIYSFIEEHVRAEGYAGALLIVGDQEIALAGAVEGPGAVLIAGTGAICCGYDGKEKRTRVGGCGHLIDDGGSGYAIGRDILSAVARGEDGRAEATCLRKMVFERLGISQVSGIVTWLYNGTTGKKEIAAFAPLLLEALKMGDAAAERIAVCAAQELAALAAAAWKNLGLEEGELALTGSVLAHYEVIREQVKAILAEDFPQMRIISPRGSAAEGAVRLAMQKR
ncbi:MAG: ATPase [Clostridia bacterium]|nr:ATPase [Clostridia bacterium]